MSATTPDPQCEAPIPWWKSNVIRGLVVSVVGLVMAFLDRPGSVGEFLADDSTQKTVGLIVGAVGTLWSLYGRVTPCAPIAGTKAAKDMPPIDPARAEDERVMLRRELDAARARLAQLEGLDIDTEPHQ